MIFKCKIIFKIVLIKQNQLKTCGAIYKINYVHPIDWKIKCVWLQAASSYEIQNKQIIIYRVFKQITSKMFVHGISFGSNSCVVSSAKHWCYNSEDHSVAPTDIDFYQLRTLFVES